MLARMRLSTEVTDPSLSGQRDENNRGGSGNTLTAAGETQAIRCCGTERYRAAHQSGKVRLRFVSSRPNFWAVPDDLNSDR